MSRLPGKRARPVLRGPRRGDASGLPDYWAVDVLQACGAHPFDRVIVAQALRRNLTIATRDSKILDAALTPVLQA